MNKGRKEVSEHQSVCPQKVTLAKTVNTEHQQLLGV